MSTEDNKAIVRRLADAVNLGTLDAVDEVFATDYVRQNPSELLREAGVQEYKQASGGILRAFPDAHWIIEELLEHRDKVIGHWTFRGTNTGSFFNLPATGKGVRYPVIPIYRIENGRIAEDWYVSHTFGL